MGRYRSKRTTPDLFATAAVRDASASPKLPAAQATTEIATQRYILPKDLHAAVKHLSDGELDLLHTAAARRDQATRQNAARRGDRLTDFAQSVRCVAPNQNQRKEKLIMLKFL